MNVLLVAVAALVAVFFPRGGFAEEPLRLTLSSIEKADENDKKLFEAMLAESFDITDGPLRHPLGNAVSRVELWSGAGVTNPYTGTSVWDAEEISVYQKGRIKFGVYLKRDHYFFKGDDGYRASGGSHTLGIAFQQQSSTVQSTIRLTFGVREDDGKQRSNGYSQSEHNDQWGIDFRHIVFSDARRFFSETTVATRVTYDFQGRRISTLNERIPLPKDRRDNHSELIAEIAEDLVQWKWKHKGKARSRVALGVVHQLMRQNSEPRTDNTTSVRVRVSGETKRGRYWNFQIMYSPKSASIGFGVSF